MTPTPPSTTSSSAGAQSPEGQFRVVRKRNRVPLSCGPCRHRKLKCNRSNPCENCIRRGDASSCSYAAPGTRRKNQSQGATSPDDMQNRIDRLEGLVLSLMTNGAQSAGPTAAHAAISRSTSHDLDSPTQLEALEEEDDDAMNKDDNEADSEVDDMVDSLGILKVDNEKHKSFYLGDTHWHLVLKDIAEVKNYFIAHKQELESQYTKVRSSLPANAIDGPAFLFGAQDCPSEDELRNSLPPRPAVEKLVTRYFNSYDPAVHILHSPTFHKELQKHYTDPSKTSLSWLGLLYSILCLANQSYSKLGDEPPEWKGKTSELASAYRLRTVQCLIVSDYTRSTDHTVEAMILYIQGEYASRWDSDVGIWVIIGIVVRLAIRMGYHRDPKHYSGLTPYQGEMRRRTWAFVKQSDIMFSFQLALPSMIRSGDSDTDYPRNIFEDEFGPDSKELPPARPVTEPTPVSYMITKSRIATHFGAIVEKLNAVSDLPVGYDEILRRDNGLRELRNTMPPHLRLRPIEECTHDPATLLMQRFSLDLFYQKSLCVLHRKYLPRAHQNPRYAHSRRACVDASMEILRHQARLYRESQPGGRMRTMKWVISSLTKHDFLLAAMLVCLDLMYDSFAMSEQRKPGSVTGYDMHFWTAEQRREMIEALQTSETLWRETAETSIEAYKATSTLRVILDKLHQCPPVTMPSSSTTSMSNSSVSASALTASASAAAAAASKGGRRTDGAAGASVSSASASASTSAPASATLDAFTPFDEDQPEHSAAMTLGMLSGGLTPNSAAILNSLSAPLPTANVDMSDAPAPAYQQQQAAGMTPDFPMDGPSGFGGANSASSPFSVFANVNAGAGLMDMPPNLDWDAWDSFIQTGNGMDASSQAFPPGFDPAQNINPGTGSEMQTDQGPFGNSVFMGANTPGRN